MKILFSKDENMINAIKKGFRISPISHTITFAEFNPQIIAEHNLVIPLLIEDVYYLNESAHLIKDNAIPVPNMEIVKLCDDKYLFSRKLIEYGFADYIPKIDEEASYPFFFKKKIDVGSVHTYLIENHEQELQLLEELDVNNEEYFRQQCVLGFNEYATHIFFKNNRIIRAITMKYIFDKEQAIKYKDKQLGMIIDKNCDEHLDLFASILERMGYNGICCFNYKIVENNRPVIFEINPRVGGSLAIYLFSFLRSL